MTLTSTKIGFVADSTCDIPADLIAKWNIGVIPAFVNYGGNSYADDGRDLDRNWLYAHMPTLKPHPTTAGFSPAYAEAILSEAAQRVEHVVVLTAPAKLSSMYNTTRLAIENLGLQQRTTLIDSNSLSMGIGFQVLAGAEMAAATDDLQQVLAEINRVRANVHVYAGLSTLEYLRRSGRVSWARAGMSALLQIKPVVGVTGGDVPQYALVRTFGRAVEKLLELARADAPLERLALLYTYNPKGAQTMKDRLADIAPPETLVVSATPLIGVHIGPESLGIATVKKVGK